MEYIKTIGLSLLPTFLVYIGKSESFFNFLKAHSFINQDSDISTSQLWCFTIGIIWAGLISPVQLAKTKKQLEAKNKKFNELLAFNNETYFKSVKTTLKKHNKNFNTRIFVPHKSISARWARIWNKKLVFALKEFEGFTDPLPAVSLHFEVTPTTQGLVGKACKEKAIVVDCEVNPQNYNLTHYQQSKTNDVKFCSTAPIFNSKNDVIAVLAVDSTDDIQFDDSEIEQWKNQIIYYCAFVDKHIKI